MPLSKLLRVLPFCFPSLTLAMSYEECKAALAEHNPSVVSLFVFVYDEENGLSRESFFKSSDYHYGYYDPVEKSISTFEFHQKQEVFPVSGLASVNRLKFPFPVIFGVTFDGGLGIKPYLPRSGNVDQSLVCVPFKNNNESTRETLEVCCVFDEERPEKDLFLSPGNGHSGWKRKHLGSHSDLGMPYTDL